MAAKSHQHKDDFDRSFEQFDVVGDENKIYSKPTNGKDPFVGNGAWGSNAVDTSFESDVFAFSAMSSAGPTLATDAPSFLVPSYSGGNASTRKVDGLPIVRVAMHEEMSAFYDDVTSEGSIHVDGTIHIKPLDNLRGPFVLILRDASKHLGMLQEDKDLCVDISESVNRKGLHRWDRVLRVSLPDEAEDREILLANYRCVPSVRPVPMLVKSRVRVSKDFTRVGFKIRANPSNGLVMTQVTIILAIPPDVDGESVKMSRKGGVWDAMKRTVAWSMDKLSPGEAMEVQAQFGSLDRVLDRTPRFPLLVRCEQSDIFSDLDIFTFDSDTASRPIQLRGSKGARMLHRKV